MKDPLNQDSDRLQGGGQDARQQAPALGGATQQSLQPEMDDGLPTGESVQNNPVIINR